MKRFAVLSVLAILTLGVFAQTGDDSFGSDNQTVRSTDRFSRDSKDTTKTNKEIPIGLKVWTIDEKLGERTEAVPDTLSHMFMNAGFTTGRYGEFNTLGNLGSPRINRIFTDRPVSSQFLFLDVFDFFHVPVEQFKFTNTLSPITNLSYNECGDKTNGEDHLKALFAINAGKKLGFGVKFDYLYGRGYYSDQNTSHFNTSFWGSYLGDRYNAHLLVALNHEKESENGGITNDNYITHPESFSDNYSSSEIPTVLTKNWNRNNSQKIFLTHRYNIGFTRKVKMTEEEIKNKKFAMEAAKDEAKRKKAAEDLRKRRNGEDFDDEEEPKQFAGRPDDAKVVGDMPADSTKKASERLAIDAQAARDSIAKAKTEEQPDTSWLKDEFVPVTSIIHTLDITNANRVYLAYSVPESYYNNTYFEEGVYQGDSIYDKTKFFSMKNTAGLALLEGFNKWAQAGIRLFATHEMRRFTMADSTGIGTQKWSENNISIGGQLVRTQSRLLHFNAKAETWLAGEDAGQLKIDGQADLNFRLFGDTVQLAAKAHFYRLNPAFLYRHYHSKHFWWDNDLDKELRTHIEGTLDIRRTGTKIRVAADNLDHYTYFGQSYNITSSYDREYTTVGVRQSGNVSLLTAQLFQNFALGPLHWENVVTYQTSSDEETVPVPQFNIYSNLFLRFCIAKVLHVDLGADARYFTKYYAPDYCPGLGAFVNQENETKTEIGDCPIVNVYANMMLKGVRFYVMMSHVAGGKNYFYTPHYPLNGRILRLGVSWTFNN